MQGGAALLDDEIRIRAGESLAGRHEAAGGYGERSTGSGRAARVADQGRIGVEHLRAGQADAAGIRLNGDRDIVAALHALEDRLVEREEARREIKRSPGSGDIQHGPAFRDNIAPDGDLSS